MEVTGEVEQDFETDVEIDFSTLKASEIRELLKQIKKRGKFTFKEVPTVFVGEVSFEIEPNDYFNDMD